MKREAIKIGFVIILLLPTLIFSEVGFSQPRCPDNSEFVDVTTGDGKRITTCRCKPGFVPEGRLCVARAPAPEISRISDIRGDVYVKNSAGVINKLGAGYELREGDVITTANNAFVEITFFASGERIWLHGNSEFKVARRSGAETLYELTKGLVRLLASGLRSTRYSVRTPTAVAAVRGTEFEISYVNGVTSIRVYQGEVGVTPTQMSDAIAVTAGYQISVNSSGKITGPKAIDGVP